MNQNFFIILSLNPESATENKQKTIVKKFAIFPSEKRRYRCTVSHFSYAPLVQCKITRKGNMLFLF